MAWPTVTITTTDLDAGTDSPGNARAQIYQIALNVNSIKDAMAQSSGIAPLDASSLLPIANLPTVTAVKGGTGQTGYTIGDLLYADTATSLSKLGTGTSGRVLTSNGVGVAPSWQISGGVPSTTRMSFNQTSAPTGWTKDTTAGLNDSIMRIVVGAVGGGGSTAFSTFNAQTATGSYTLTIADIPSHTHTAHTHNNNSFATGNGGLGNSPQAQTASNTGAQGGGGAHSHSLTYGIKYNDFIIATKD